MMNNQLIKPIKIILAILLLLCLASMPYGYFQLVRFLSMIGFPLLAYDASENGRKTEAFIWLAIAILFQPFIKVALGRTIWNIVDVIVAVILLLSLNIKKSK